MFEARRCTELRDVHFITPALVSNLGDGVAALLLGMLLIRREMDLGGYGKNEDKGKGKGSGKDKGKGKGNGKGSSKSKFDLNLPTTTPDGKQICFACNNQHERCSHGKACRRELPAAVLNHIPCTCATRTSARPMPRALERWTWLVFAPRPAVRKGAAVVHQQLVCLQLP